MQTFFGRYLRRVKPKKATVYELKICKGNSLPFSSIDEHQYHHLERAKRGGFYHKITDQPWGMTSNIRYTSKKPFDCMWIRGLESYLIVWFYKPRKQKIFYQIDIDSLLKMKETCGRKSMTEAMAHDFGTPLRITEVLKRN